MSSAIALSIDWRLGRAGVRELVAPVGAFKREPRLPSQPDAAGYPALEDHAVVGGFSPAFPGDLRTRLVVLDHDDWVLVDHFEVLGKVLGDQLGRRVAVVEPHTFGMADAVAIMTGAMARQPVTAP